MNSRVCDCVHNINENVLEASIDSLLFGGCLSLYDNNESISMTSLETILMDTARMNIRKSSNNLHLLVNIVAVL